MVWDSGVGDVARFFGMRFHPFLVDLMFFGCREIENSPCCGLQVGPKLETNILFGIRLACRVYVQFLV
jgi:hypothetical protein